MFCRDFMTWWLLLIRSVQYLLGESPVPIDGDLFESDKEPLVGQGTHSHTPAQRSSSEHKTDPENMV